MIRIRQKRLSVDIGSKFNKLTLLENIRIGKRKYGIFECECGTKKEIMLWNVANGRVKSCGCILGKATYVHGLHNHRLYNIFYLIRYRCYNKKCLEYKNYGGRGIQCEWDSISDFVKDMESSYREGLQIDRINNDGNYCKENCRWVTSSDNCKNRRSNIMVGGLCLWDYCKVNSLKYSIIQARITTLGWSIEKAINTPIKHKK